MPPAPPGDTFAEASNEEPPYQELEACLVDADDNVVHTPVTFTATAVDRLVLVDAGGNGQIGQPGETLEIALRARVSAGSTPAEAQHVAFEIESRMFDGEALDEITGGSLHASTNVISTEPWPGGGRTVRAVVATDADGVAQVQWILGTEVGLPVQRVTATLLDAQGAETAQRTLYLANLTTAEQVSAGDVGWDVCKPLGARLPQVATVQDALDVYCNLLGTLATTGTIITTDGGRLDLGVHVRIALIKVAGLELDIPVALPGTASIDALHAAVAVSVDVKLRRYVRPLPDNPQRPLQLVESPNAGIGGAPLSRHAERIYVRGSVTADRGPQGTTLTWKPQPVVWEDFDGFLLTPELVNVDLRPSAFFTRSGIPPVPWHSAFYVS